MKIACLLSKGEGEKYHNQIKAGIDRIIPILGNYELVYDAWGEPMSYELFSNILADIEHNGPDVIHIPASFFANYADAPLVIGSFTPFTGENLHALQSAKILGIMRAGIENIHLEDATACGIAVINAMGRNADAVSDFTIGMMLAESRNIARSHHMIRQGTWSKSFPNSANIRDMRAKTVGLFGFGQIGSLMARKLSGFDMQILVYDPYVSDETIANYGCTRANKQELFARADFISVHARLTEDTQRIIGADEFAAMKPTAYFINTARSGLVDTDALCNALTSGQIAGAAIDVFDEEPLPTDSPLLGLENVTLTPHLAGSTKDSSANTIRLIIEGFRDIIANNDTRRVLNPEVTQTEEFQRWREAAKQEMGI